MSEIRQILKKSITRRFTAMMLTFLSLLVAGAVIVLYMNYSAFSQYQTTLKASMEKRVLVEQIVEHTNQIFFRARGYYAFLNPNEYNQLFVEKQKLEQAIAAYKKLPLTSQEQIVVSSIESFQSNFFTNVFPTASGYAKAGDYEGLRAFSSSGVNQEVNNLMSYAANYKKQNEQLLLQENSTLFANVISQSQWFVLYIVVVLIFSIWVTRRTTRDIGAPLERLSVEADRFSRGELPHFQDLHRVDEIGNLARSLDYLIRQIQVKEETLMAQNEELQAQQDELMMQQEELQEAFAKMEDNERYLQKRNRLIQSLANTLDKQELLQSIIRNIVEVMDADKGVIVLMNTDQDVSSFGVSELGVDQFLRGLDHGPLVRVQETREPYVLVRASTDAERGYQEAFSQTYELYLPVLHADQELVACIVVSRIGRSLSPQEQQMAMGLSKQISLSLDKLAMHEETEKQRQITQDMLDTIQEGVQLVDNHGVTVQVNRTFRELLHFDQCPAGQPLELSGYFRHMDGLICDHQEFVTFVKTALSEDGTGGFATHLIELTHPHVRYIQLYAEHLFRDQKKWGTLLVYRDITKEYEIDQMKSEFVSTVSHELRTPLASVLGFAELLLNKELKPERQQRYMTAIYQEAKRLTALINDFLDLQRMESGRQSYEEEQVAIDQLIREVFALYRVQSTRHTFHLELLTEHTTIRGDKSKLHQMLMNLIGNAVKYSPQGGQIRVICRREGNRLALDVQDEGLGIPAESIPHLFTKFYRVDNSDRREIGGTGLGLSIVLEIVRVHQGEVSVVSEEGTGSTFTVKLPLSGSPGSADQNRLSPPFQSIPPHPNGQIVLIEDDANLLELLRDELVGSGFTVYPFSKATPALQAIEQIRPDAIVLDLLLADGEDGWKVIEGMRDNPELQAIPIIISSALEEKKKAFEWGANGYLIKPYHPDTLSKTILLAISNREAAGQILIPE